MNPLKPLIDLVKFIYNDFKSDFTFIRDVSTGKEKIEFDKEEIKKFSIKKMLKDAWLWYLIIILAFCVGWFVASQHYQDKCNNFIIDNYMNGAKTRNYGEFYIDLDNLNINVTEHENKETESDIFAKT